MSLPFWLLLTMPWAAPIDVADKHLSDEGFDQIERSIAFSDDWFQLPCNGETKIGCFGVRYHPSSDPIGYLTYLKEVEFGELAADFSMNNFHVFTFKVRVPITRYKKLVKPIRDY